MTGIGNQGVSISYLYSGIAKKMRRKRMGFGRIFGVLMCMRELRNLFG